ncbi:sensor histidine kinase [Nonomuraea sp. M3C6]|uniref:histidine kinase n=1 Tax=Nonomuraea marmarensis TaxID=3351344 RepID=A0ABW7ADF6_9ACTN
MAASLLALIILGALAATTGLALRYSQSEHIYDQAEDVAGQWTTAARTIPPNALLDPLPASGDVDLIQIVDSRGAVLAASHAARGRPPLTHTRPTPDDPVARLSDGRHVIVAIRTSLAAAAPVVVAGRSIPAVLRGHNLEFLLAALALALVAGAGAITWTAVGRALRPVQALRTHMAQITLNDLSRRMPVPPGDGEIAELARTADHTLARLDEAVAQQRRFASNTSHELRNPIAGLRAQLEDALEHPEDTDTHDTLQSALTTTDRLDAIVTDLLAQARLHATTSHELINLTQLVTQETTQPNGAYSQPTRIATRTKSATTYATGNSLKEATGIKTTGTHHGPQKAVPVRLHTHGDVWICGSRIQLIRALANLVSNARRHATTAVDITLTSVDGQAVIAVTDDGPGIPPADRQRVFERFTRLDDGRRLDTGGSGLGLAITRDIAHHHRGTLTLEDSPGGARFVLRIPQLDSSAIPQPQPPRAIAEPAPPAARKSKELMRNSAQSARGAA